MQSGAISHVAGAKKGGDLDNGVLVVVGLEKGKLLREEAKEHHPDRPNVDRYAQSSEE